MNASVVPKSREAKQMRNMAGEPWGGCAEPSGRTIGWGSRSPCHGDPSTSKILPPIPPALWTCPCATPWTSAQTTVRQYTPATKSLMLSTIAVHADLRARFARTMQGAPPRRRLARASACDGEPIHKRPRLLGFTCARIGGGVGCQLHARSPWPHVVLCWPYNPCMSLHSTAAGGLRVAPFQAQVSRATPSEGICEELWIPSFGFARACAQACAGSTCTPSCALQVPARGLE